MGLKNKKKIIAIILIVIIVIISGITYGYWNKEYIGKDNTNNFNCLKIEVKENKEGISLNNAYPITDEEGIETEGYEVTIENKCEIVGNYEVILNEIQGSNLKEEHIKVAVDKNYQILSKYEKVNPRIENSEKAYKIKEGIITPKAKIKILVQEWIDYDTTKEEGENKTFNNKITIESTTKINDKLLAGKIIKENKVIEEEPDFKAGFPNANTSEEEIKKLSGLYKTEDNEGTSYYFRGAVENNYVQFGKGKTINNQEEDDLIWRIVRINGDGTIRLMLNSLVTTSQVFNTSYSGYQYAGYTRENNSPCTNTSPCKSTYIENETFENSNGGINSDIKTYLESWYQENLAQTNINGKKADKYIATTTFCNDTSYGNGKEDSTSDVLNYGANDRIYAALPKPSLKCPDPYKQGNSILRDYGGVYKLKIGLISADELNLGGYSFVSRYETAKNYLKRTSWYWSMSPNDASALIAGIMNAYTYHINVNNKGGVVPVINLKADVQVTGDGSEQSPFIVN